MKTKNMTSEKILPHVSPVEATRFVASKVGHYALYAQKGHREADFTRPNARIEREQIATLPLSKVGAAALFQFSLEDASVHIPELS